MTSQKVRADYEQLNQIARVFGQQAEAAGQVLGALQQDLNTLQGGSWKGKGSDKFYREMNAAILPAMKRVIAAMNEASTTTAKISRIMKQAEDDAAAVFKLNGASDLPGQGQAESPGPASETGAAGPETPAAPDPASPEVVMLSAKAKASSPGKAPKPAPHAGVPDMGGQSNPIPDPTGVYPYDGIPKRDGGFLKGGLGSRAVATWTARFKQVGHLIEAQRQELARLKSLLNTVIGKEGADVLAAARKDFPKGMQKLNKMSGNKALELVNKYRNLGDDLKKSDLDVAAAEKDLAEKRHVLEALKAERMKFDANKDKTDWQAKKDAIKEAIQERKDIAKTLTEIAGKAGSLTTPTGIAKEGLDLIPAIVGRMTEEERRKIIEADYKIEVLQEVMNKAADRALTELNQAAQAGAESATLKLGSAHAAAQNIEKAQMRTLDELAQLEKNHGTGRTFQELQDYNQKVRPLGNELRKANGDYINSLEHTPSVADAGQLARRVDQDVQHVRIYERNDEQWLEQARGTGRYLDQLERWRQGEIKASNELGRSLAEGRHVQVIDQVMDLATRSLNGTQTDGSVIR